MNGASTTPATPADRYGGAFVGLALGSALGHPVESMSAQQVRIKIGLIESLRAGGWRGLRRGEHTPEAELALVLGRALVAVRGYDRAAVAGAYLEWFRAGRRELEETTRSVFTLMDQGVPFERVAEEAYENATAKDADCAALLRVVPLVLLHARDAAALRRDVAAEVSLTDHGRDIMTAALTYAFLLAAFLRGAGDPAEALQATRIALDECTPPIRCPLAPPAVAAGDLKVRASGRPLDNLETVWSAVCSARRPRNALVRVVSGGEDAATAGALTGALMGARCGLAGFPNDWIEGLLDGFAFERCAQGLCAIAGCE
ncbi:MAG: ADP-ribosylglycohydrolase family protein [Planctomycetes bacterium]|nr:ADP-ribosylglycohydrolase family protein [Planctomycetota bacterium]